MSAERQRRIADVLASRSSRLVLVVENLYDPHNLSAILRSADGFGVQRVILTGSAPDGLNPLVAVGAERWLTLERIPESGACLDGLRAEGFTVAAAALTEEAHDPREWSPRGPVALVLGNERDGLSPTFLRGADALLRIPLPGFSRSLNVSVAAGVLLWTLLDKPALRKRGLPHREAGELRDLWARLSVDQSESILKRLRGEGRGGRGAG